MHDIESRGETPAISDALNHTNHSNNTRDKTPTMFQSQLSERGQHSPALQWLRHANADEIVIADALRDNIASDEGLLEDMLQHAHVVFLQPAAHLANTPVYIVVAFVKGNDECSERLAGFTRLRISCRAYFEMRRNNAQSSTISCELM